VDEVIQVGDKESFLWARRLVRDEGIFCGGSSGSALAAAMQYAARLEPEHLLVVLLPDSGSRYLSKFYDDKWMRENRYLETEWCEATLEDVLSSKPKQELAVAHEQDRLGEVISLMKSRDISQMPVLSEDGSVSGLVTELDLLKYLVEDNHTQATGQTIASMMRPAKNIYPSSTSIEDVLPAMVRNQFVLVVEQGRPVGVLTKIDLLDFITQGMI
jgi:cystathionine beta-synthase